MAYITPETFIYVMNVPFDETYQHTIFFDTETEQSNYFNDRANSGYKFQAQSFQRHNRNYCRIQQRADRLYNMNYMMFRNQNHGNKWFYAFITDVNYINEHTTEIEYEIDAMQTYHFNYTLNQCFVEREHSSTDQIGDNLVPEGLELGDYVIDDRGTFQPFNGNLSIVIASTDTFMSEQDHTIVDGTGQWYAGIYSGLTFNAFTNLADANDFIEGVVAKHGNADSIAFLFMCPSDFLQAGNSEAMHADITTLKPYTSIGSYVPQNKKLFTAPYQFCCIDNGETIANYPWEYFNDSTNATFRTYASAVSNGQYMIIPTGYKGATYNTNEALIGNAGVMCSYNVDTYKAWLAQNQYTLAAQEKVIERNSVMANARAGFQTGLGLGEMLSVTDNLAGRPSIRPTNPLLGGSISDNQSAQLNSDMSNSNFINGIFSRMSAVTQYQNAMDMLSATKQTATLKPRVAQGSTTNGIRVASGLYRPRVYNMHIREEFARIIDGYFSRYGYATHKFKIPNRKVRERWTYVKTVDCSISGSVPNEYSDIICNVYNSGITFWRNGVTVCDYNHSNGILV